MVAPYHLATACAVDLTKSAIIWLNSLKKKLAMNFSLIIQAQPMGFITL